MMAFMVFWGVCRVYFADLWKCVELVELQSGLRVREYVTVAPIG